jgi:hypothetical protein
MLQSGHRILVKSTNFINIITHLVYLTLKKMGHKNKFGKGICYLVVFTIKETQM